ncbi:MAG: hypothetical protein CM15mP59_2250 [Flavobacteriaceae bacterium]|nr:MAG: hypothetical protein CM15mP59_2250 [Flavobacteriaceae bacterium]
MEIKYPVNMRLLHYLGYDQNAIYIGAILKHPNPDKILKNLVSVMKFGM